MLRTNSQVCTNKALSNTMSALPTELLQMLAAKVEWKTKGNHIPRDHSKANVGPD